MRCAYPLLDSRGSVSRARTEPRPSGSGQTIKKSLVTPRAMKIPAVAHLTSLLLRHSATHPAMRVHPESAVGRRLQVHRFCVAEETAIGNLRLNMASHALRHGRKIRLAGHVRCVDALVARQTRNRRHVLVVRKVRQRNLARLLDRRRRLVTLQTYLGLRQIVVFDASALRHRSMAGGALQLQRQVCAMRKIGARRHGREGHQRYRLYEIRQILLPPSSVTSMLPSGISRIATGRPQTSRLSGPSIQPVTNCRISPAGLAFRYGVCWEVLIRLCLVTPAASISNSHSTRC